VDTDDFLAIGKISGVHGVKGNLKIFSYAATPAYVQKDGSVLILHPSGKKKAYGINWLRPHKKGALLSLREVTSRDLAEELVGCEILVNKRDLPDLEDGTYYWFDLIGLSVHTDDNRYIGRLDSIIETGSNDVYVVKDENGTETLIPALVSVVLDVDLENQTMRVTLPDGL
jgi:16S rRNA processing protein RimM